MSDGALPNLVVIGAAKCGTSSLHYYLGLHPEIGMSRMKEPQFFIHKDGFDPEPFISEPREQRLFGEASSWPMGLDWYRALFPADAPVRGESTVAYTYPWYHDTAERMAAVIPDAKLVYVVREPLGRILSHYLMYAGGGREWRSAADALADPRNMYLATTRYTTALDPYLRLFGRERIHIVRQDQLLAERREALKGIFRFVGVDEDFWSDQMDFRRNRSDVKGPLYRTAERIRRTPPGRLLVRSVPGQVKARVERMVAGPAGSRNAPELPPEVEATLRSVLDPEIAGLEALTGWDLATWRGNGSVAAG